MQTIIPYLRVKKCSAETVLEFRKLQSTGNKHRTKTTGYRNFPNSHGVIRKIANKSFSDEYVEMCDSFYCRCKEINKTGV